MRHARAEPTGKARGDGAAERESGQPQRTVAGEHLDEGAVHEVQINGARGVARDRGRVAVRGMVEGVHREACREGIDVAGPVPPGPHAAVKEHDVRARAGPAHRHAWPRVRGRVRAHIARNHGIDRPVWTCYGNITIIWPAPGGPTARRAPTRDRSRERGALT